MEVEGGSAGVVVGELFDLFRLWISAIERGAAVGLGDEIEEAAVVAPGEAGDGSVDGNDDGGGALVDGRRTAGLVDAWLVDALSAASVTPAVSVPTTSCGTATDIVGLSV